VSGDDQIGQRALQVPHHHRDRVRASAPEGFGVKFLCS
jgi:hypothetical protein